MSRHRLARLEERLKMYAGQHRRQIFYILRDEDTTNDQAIQAVGVDAHNDDLVIFLIHFGDPTRPRLVRID